VDRVRPDVFGAADGGDWKVEPVHRLKMERPAHQKGIPSSEKLAV
jgi:hypothetical protein